MQYDNAEISSRVLECLYSITFQLPQQWFQVLCLLSSSMCSSCISLLLVEYLLYLHQGPFFTECCYILCYLIFVEAEDLQKMVQGKCMDSYTDYDPDENYAIEQAYRSHMQSINIIQIQLISQLISHKGVWRKEITKPVRLTKLYGSIYLKVSHSSIVGCWFSYTSYYVWRSLRFVSTVYKGMAYCNSAI